MGERAKILSQSRRRFLSVTIPLLSLALPVSRAHSNEDVDETLLLVQKLTGKIPITSERLQLDMPHVFPNGYTVPVSITVDSSMTDDDYVKIIRVLAPENPLIEVATFHFVPHLSVPRVSTRIRLAAPQNVLALAEMNDGTLLLAKAWVSVASNGCK